MKKTPSERANLYNKEHYDRILVILPMGEKKRLKKHAEIKDQGKVNRFIVRAIYETMRKETKENAKH